MVVRPSLGLSFSFADSTRPEALDEVARDETKLVWIETPTRPLLKLRDKTFKLSSCTTSEPGHYVKSLGEPRDGGREFDEDVAAMRLERVPPLGRKRSRGGLSPPL